MLVPEIIAETDELLVLNKPAGLIVHSDGRTVEPSLADWILQHYPALAGVGEPWMSPQGEHILLPGIVHRLDRTTSGVMLVAKTLEMYSYLKGEFKARRIDKLYRAIVYGRMETEGGKIVAEIMRTTDAPRRWYARPCDESDKRAAITEWRLLGTLTDTSGDVASYLELHPQTGRTHQIRVHLASIGHPLVADHVYAEIFLAGTPALENPSVVAKRATADERAPILGFKRPALHAYSISLMIGDVRETYVAPLPGDFIHAV